MLAEFGRNLRHGTRISEVPMKDIRCIETPFGEVLRYAGKPIHYFPPHMFFEVYLQDPPAAVHEFCRWLEACFIQRRAWTVPKQEGGWRGGSLMKVTSRLHADQGVDLQGDMTRANPALIKLACLYRAEHYFGVLESLQENGFIASFGYPSGMFKEGLFYLRNGHHRVSALSALGYQEVKILDCESR